MYRREGQLAIDTGTQRPVGLLSARFQSSQQGLEKDTDRRTKDVCQSRPPGAEAKSAYLKK